jgi:ParB-like chromosome segregation protein Spo0J
MPSSRPVAWAYESWPTSELAKTIKHPIDDQKINSLVESLQQDLDLPPIFVLIADGNVRILDGHHRVLAWLKAGIDSVPVLVGRVR